MKIFNHLLHFFINTFFSSATPNLFGSRRRRKEKESLAGSFKNYAAQTQEEIERLKIQNPFEGAAAKSAMATSSRKARQTQQRFANVMGGNINPESMVAAQQATQEAVAGTAGDIAVGAEAQKQAGLSQLRGEKAGYMGQAAQAQQAAINERGAGWRDFFSGIGSITPFVSGAMKGGSAAVSQ